MDRIESTPRTTGIASGIWRDPTLLAGAVAEWLAREHENMRQGGIDPAPLRRYYGEMFGLDGRPLEIVVFAYVQRIWPLIGIIRDSPKPLRILDAGCGYGTEAYLAALMGHKVIGVELVSERVKVARSRFPFFTSTAGRRLDVDFICANIFKYLSGTEKFDVIWVMEAISHIYPPEKFLSLTLRTLSERGKIVISDPNRLNPKSLWRSIRIRGSLVHRPHTRFRDPVTGKPVDYGQEQITTPRTLARMLRRLGFEVHATTMSGFMATTLLPAKLLADPRIEKNLRRLPYLLNRIPLLRSLGSTYTLVASPARHSP